MKNESFRTYCETAAFEQELIALYGENALIPQRQRYLRIFSRFCDRFPQAKRFDIFSAPGRIEVGGNHTDHQLGHVLAMAVDLDTVAFAMPNTDRIIRFVSKDYQIEPIDLDHLEIRKDEYYTTMGLIRGLAFYFKEIYGAVGGFDAYVESNVYSGSGLSSSASVEVLIAKILESYYGSGKLSPSTMAMIAQKAENCYFNKPCGLMDQMVIAHGGFCVIDFYDKENPLVTKIDSGTLLDPFEIALIQTGGSHADLSGDYAEIFTDCKTIAAYFKQEVLSRVDEAQFNASLKKLYAAYDTRAILRAHHFFTENRRVLTLTQALAEGDRRKFLDGIIASGNSSSLYLRNTWNAHSDKQGLALGLMMAQEQLNALGAWRVHGGGFAGTILLFIPKPMHAAVKKAMEEVFGNDSFITVRPRQSGVIRFNP